MFVLKVKDTLSTSSSLETNRYYKKYQSTDLFETNYAKKKRRTITL